MDSRTDVLEAALPFVCVTVLPSLKHLRKAQ